MSSCVRLSVCHKPAFCQYDMTMYDSPLADLERQQCYSGDTLMPVIAASVSEPQTPAPGHPESSHTQAENPASSVVDSPGSVTNTVDRSNGSS